ncbi:hypothetical protein XFF6166_80030 [Xanthomonas citri pv. fuscans]|nr:hypothetical protein XFF6166_80030 [Xanthomonas citri pv. fuscans]SON99809.1 hypothetical protein XFF6960_200083 [Xanthomonas citri pv. fuscans]SOO03141.1 hypothetical protein XFF7767_150029 [Xanthomonas citri pv. fuscans]SOO09299.1 hypothetical protein XFF6970_330081 [Xanthomonas citri pv. fuscans]SOO15605.1 hypothetical protein XFF7766_600030 [Xanthomonas citri pv. fuscans]
MGIRTKRYVRQSRSRTAFDGVRHGPASQFRYRLGHGYAWQGHACQSRIFNANDCRLPGRCCSGGKANLD